MGGFGSINLALRHPIYSHIYILCTGLFDENGFGKAFNDWTVVLKMRMVQLFHPIPSS